MVSLTQDKHPFGGQEVDASSLGWAMSAVSSRAFRLYGEKDPNGIRIDIPMMLPLIDMCNHSFNPNARIVQEQDTSDSKMKVRHVFSYSFLYSPQPPPNPSFHAFKKQSKSEFIFAVVILSLVRLWPRQQLKKMIPCYSAMAV